MNINNSELNDDGFSALPVILTMCSLKVEKIKSQFCCELNMIADALKAVIRLRTCHNILGTY